jgi:hypothetical protein
MKMSSVKLRRVIWYKFTDVSEVLAASIIITVSTSDCIPSNDTMINKYFIGKDLQESGRGLI